MKGDSALQLLPPLSAYTRSILTGKTSLLLRWIQVTDMLKKDMASPMKFISRLKNVFLTISLKRRMPCSLRVILTQKIRRVLVEAHMLFLGLSGQRSMQGFRNA